MLKLKMEKLQVPLPSDDRLDAHPYILMNYQGKPRRCDDVSPRIGPWNTSGIGIDLGPLLRYTTHAC